MAAQAREAAAWRACELSAAAKVYSCARRLKGLSRMYNWREAHSGD
jgi:hypothetical protein